MTSSTDSYSQVVKICVVGSFNMDLTVATTRLPCAGETVLGGRYWQSPGGKGSNQAIGARRLGADVAMVGAVGSDGYGKEMLALHGAEGVDIANVATSDLATGVALITVDSAGENQIVVAPGANTSVGPDLVGAAGETIAGADILLCQLEVPIEAVARAAEIAAANSTTVILNPAPYQRLDSSLLANVDFLIPNEHELAEMLTDLGVLNQDRQSSGGGAGGGGAGGGGVIDAARAWLVEHNRSREGRPLCVICTQGGAGATLISDSETVTREAPRVGVVDTTGAGDAFNAGFAVGLAETGSRRSALDLALQVGALACTKPGVINSLPKRSELPHP